MALSANAKKRRDRRRKAEPIWPAIIGGLIFAVSVGVIIWGTYVTLNQDVDSLAEADQTRSSNLSNINYAIRRYYSERGKLPRSLPDLLVSQPKDMSFKLEDYVKDPISGSRYEYRMIGQDRYMLCATFSKPSRNRWSKLWNHPAGHHCFPFEMHGEDPNDVFE
jgi:hypothetical protein